MLGLYWHMYWDLEGNPPVRKVAGRPRGVIHMVMVTQ
jgi:hypothetical protein